MVARRMKRFIRASLAAFILLVAVVIPVLAVDTYNYYLDITITDTSGAARTNVVVMTGVSPTNLNAAGYILSTGLDTAIKDGQSLTSTDLQYYLNSTQTALVLPTLGAYQARTVRLYMGFAPNKTAYPIVVGTGGYITTTDADALEPANNFQIEVNGYFNTTSGADKNILSKSNALQLYVSNTNEITGTMFGTAASAISYTTGEDGGGDVFGVNWTAQTFTTVGALGLSNINLLLYKAGSPGATLTVSLYATSGGKPTGSSLATTTLATSVITTDTAGVYYVFSLPYSLAASTMYSVVTSCTGGSAGNEVYWKWDATAPSYTGGTVVISADSGATWTVQSTIDAMFNVVASPATSVAAAGITSGVHDIILSADTTNLKIYDGVTLKGTTALAGASVVDNSNNFIWLQTNVCPYVTYIKYTVGGALVITYQPPSLYTNPTVNDLTGAAQNGTITWGANSSLNVAVSGVGSYASTVNTSVAGSSGGGIVDPLVQPGNWYATGNVNLPFYSTFNSAATALGMTTQTLYVWFMLGLAAGAGLMLVVFTGSPMLAAVACGVVMAGGVSSAVLSAWMLYTYIVLAVGVLYVARQN